LGQTHQSCCQTKREVKPKRETDTAVLGAYSAEPSPPTHAPSMP